MSLYTGFYIADYNDALVYEYPLAAAAPTYKTLCTRVKSITSTQEMDSTLKLGEQTLYSYRSEYNKLVYWLLAASSDEAENPYQPVSFLRKVDDILTDYFGRPTVSPVKIEGNYDVLSLILLNIIDAQVPYLTDLNTLKELAPPKSSIAKIITSTTTSLTRSLQNASQNISTKNIREPKAVPWRTVVKHTNNELFIDIEETVNVVMTPTHLKKKKRHTSAFYNTSFDSLKTVSGNINGKLIFTSNLTGAAPEVHLQLYAAGNKWGIPSFHRCISIADWQKANGFLNFIPPDGKSTLLEYTLDTSESRATNLVQVTGFETGIGLNHQEFEIRVSLELNRNVTKVDNLVIEIHADDKIKSLRTSHGGFEYKGNGVGHWIFDKETTLGSSAIFAGTVEGGLQPKFCKVSYSAKGSLPSGIKVDWVKVVKGFPANVTPFKGVKYLTTTGDYIVRA